MPLHSAQHGVMWEQPGPGYGPGPLGSMQASISVCHDPLDTILQRAPEHTKPSYSALDDAHV